MTTWRCSYHLTRLASTSPTQSYMKLPKTVISLWALHGEPCVPPIVLSVHVRMLAFDHQESAFIRQAWIDDGLAGRVKDYRKVPTRTVVGATPNTSTVVQFFEISALCTDAPKLEVLNVANSGSR